MILLMTPDGEVAALGAHRIEPMEPPLFGRLLYILAVGLRWQGKRTDGGVRVSDALLASVLADVVGRSVPDGEQLVVTALVHSSNVRSVRLLHRNELVDAEQVEGDYVRIFSRF